MKEVLCIIINHDHNELLKKNLENLNNLPDKTPFDILLINNLDDNKFRLWVNNNYPNISIINNKIIHGFSSNVNKAIKDFGSDYKYYCLINPDIKCHPNIIDKLYLYMNQHDDVGITGPLLYNLDGSVQFSCRSYPTPTDSIGRAFHLDKLNKSFFSDYLMKDYNHDKIMTVDWVTGAFMFIRASALRKVGLFDSENFFLYCEDIDICRRMWESSWKVIYNPKGKATHDFIRAGANNIFSKYFFYQFKSTLNYYKKYGFNNKELL